MNPCIEGIVNVTAQGKLMSQRTLQCKTAFVDPVLTISTQILFTAQVPGANIISGVKTMSSAIDTLQIQINTPNPPSNVTVLIKMIDVVYNQPVTELYAELHSGNSKLATKTDSFGVLKFTSTTINPLYDG